MISVLKANFAFVVLAQAVHLIDWQNQGFHGSSKSCIC
jgi:hypothetical protein